MSRRTMRPSRRSVGCGWCAAGAVTREVDRRIVLVLAMRRLCANCGKTTISAPESRSGGNDSHAHIGGLGRARQQANRNEIDAGLGIGANILQANSARALHGDGAAALKNIRLRAALDGAPHILY